MKPPILTQAASVYPLTVVEMQAHSRVLSNAEASVVDSFIKAATKMAEKLTGKSFLTQKWRQYLDCFPRELDRWNRAVGRDLGIKLSRGPIATVDHVYYLLMADGSQTELLVNTDFILDPAATPPEIVPAYQKNWPFARDIVNAVYIDYTAGYGDTSDKVDDDIRQALRLMVAGWYENREWAIPGVTLNELPGALSINALLGINKSWRV